MLRAYIAYDRAKDSWLLMQLLHHLAGDHSALEVMQQEVQEHLLGRADRLGAPLPFRNLVAQARLGVSQQEHEVFFRNMLGDIDEPTAPFGLLEVRGDGRGIEDAWLAVEAGLARQLRALARRLSVSAASLCHLAWARVMAALSGRDDVVFGTVLFGRMAGSEDSGRVMGLFINTLPLRISIGDEPVEASVQKTHALLAELMRHEHASLALAQRCSAVPAPAPLFSALLNYRHSPGAAQPLSQDSLLAWEGISWLRSRERTNYPVTLSVDDLGEGFGLSAQTVASIAPMRVCQFMHTALESLAEALQNTPAAPLHTLQVLPTAERHQLLYGWNDTRTEFPADKCVHGTVPRAGAKNFPGCYRCGLRRRAAQLCRAERQSQPVSSLSPEDSASSLDDRIALCLERGFDMIVALHTPHSKAGARPIAARCRLSSSTASASCSTMPSPARSSPNRTCIPCSGISTSTTRFPILLLSLNTAAWHNVPDSNPDPEEIGLTPPTPRAIASSTPQVPPAYQRASWSSTRGWLIGFYGCSTVTY